MYVYVNVYVYVYVYAHKRIQQDNSAKNSFISLSLFLTTYLVCRASPEKEGEAPIQAAPPQCFQAALCYLRCKQLCHLSHVTQQTLWR